MPELICRRLGREEEELLVQCRLDYCLRDEPAAAPAELACFRSAVEKWTREHLATGQFVGYAGSIDGKTACFAGLQLYTLPPTFEQSERRVGHILSFFTYPRHRRQGLGLQLMDFIIKDASALGLQRLVLNATTMGEPLYRKAGFRDPVMPSLELPIR